MVAPAVPADLITPTSGKLYWCPTDVVVHLQDVRTQRVLLSVRGERERTLRFSLPGRETPVYGVILREHRAKHAQAVRLVAAVPDDGGSMHHEQLCRAFLRPGDVLRVELKS